MHRMIMKKVLLFMALAATLMAAIACEKSNKEEAEDIPDGPFEFGAVDLGLSVKWANANVGADSPEVYGDYYAWGETETKTNYDWDTYKWADGSYDKLTKYNTSNSWGKVDGVKTLQRGEASGETVDDAARAVLQGAWRMPTQEDWDNLISGCNWKWTTYKKVKGWKVSSKTNSNYIFIPAAGYMSESSLQEDGATGLYWSSSVNSTGMSFYAWHMVVYSGSSAPKTEATARYFGTPIRAVIAE